LQEEYSYNLKLIKSILTGGNAIQNIDELDDFCSDLIDIHESISNTTTQLSDEIDDIESSSSAFFQEWSREIDDYSSENLRRSGQSDLDQSESAFISTTRQLEQSLSEIKKINIVIYDQVLYYKHKLNTATISIDIDKIRNDILTVDKGIAESSHSLRAVNKYLESLNN